MKNDNWIETKRECEVNDNGEWITKKVTLERVKKSGAIFGLELKDAFDVGFKILGLSAIIITALTYFNTVQQAKQEKREYAERFSNIEKNIELQKKADQHSFIVQKDLEKKLEAVGQIKDLFAKLSIERSKTGGIEGEPNQENLMKLAVTCGDSIDNKSFLFSKPECEQFYFCLINYLLLYEIPCKDWKKYSSYFDDAIDHNFNLALKKSLEPDLNDDYVHLMPLKDLNDLIETLNSATEPIDPSAILDTNFNFWKNSIEELAL